MKNYGVIMGRNDTDWVGGSIPYEVRNPSGDWTPYLPVGEIQRGKEDYMDCVSRSNTNCIELQEKLLTGIESNYSERELAKGGGTTQQGARLTDIAEYGRKTGYAQQTTYPDSGGNWAEQFTSIPADIQVKLNVEKADWLSKWTILHEDITDLSKKSLQYHLKHAPLQVVVPGHAITEILSMATLDKIFDSYEPFVKDVPGSYYPGPIVFAKKIVLYKKEQAVDNDMLLVDIKLGDTGGQVLRLKRALRRCGWFLKNGMEAQDFWDIYNDRIKDLVFRFQLANLERVGWVWWWAFFWYRGSLVDIHTREVINKLLTIKK